MSDDDDQGRSGGRKWRRLFALLVFLGGGGGIGAYFKVWDKYAPTWLQSKVGYGALASPQDLKREAGGREGESIRAAALGQQVRWTAKVVEVRRPLVGNPSVIARHEDVIVTVNFPESADSAIKALTEGADFTFEGRLTKVPPDAMVVDDASVAK